MRNEINISTLSNTELKNLLLDLFFVSNGMMLKRDLSEICKNVSERSICSNLKEMINLNLQLFNIKGYYADVEYNRGPGHLLKAININNEDMPIQCDLIVHSRGQLTNDNLICIEMKKEGVRGIDSDRSRIKEMTKNELFCRQRNNLFFVSGYKLGILYIYNYKEETLSLEFYENGQLVSAETYSFSYYIQKYTNTKYKNLCFWLFNWPSSITSYNMGFGDSFLIHNCSKQLLVDCGSNNANMVNWDTFTKPFLIDDLKNSENDLLITHYHRDHFNKIGDLLKKGIRFKNIFIRYLGTNYLSFDVKSFYVELAHCFTVSHDFNTVFYWTKKNIFKNLLKTGGKVIGINSIKNNHFYIGTLRTDVLWPSPSCVYDIVKKTEKEDIDALLAKYPYTKRRLDKLISFFSETFKDGEATYERFYESYEEESDEELASLELELKKMVETDEFKHIHEKLQDLENHLSIVFAISNDLLMCGDADEKAMNQALKNYTNTTFDIVKTPHHGTTSYFLNKCWSKNTILLIPNSISRSLAENIDLNYVSTALECWNLNSTINSACPMAAAGKCSKTKSIVLPFKRFIF